MAAMGVQEVPDQAHTETLTARLADRDALVVLDNCEHLLAAAAALAETLARSCGRLAVLATSREPLGVAGEVVWRVPCLSVPLPVPEEQGPVGTEALDASEAARLFIDRARAARPNFAVTDDNAPAVAAICQRLDGIPLAIELAAARARMMSAEHIAEALADRFHLLAGGARSAIPRQATLRASVDWSYELLPEPERALLRRLSVFAGGLTLDAAERVGAAGEVGRYDVLGLLSALVDKSLVQVNEKGDHYGLLETIRAYAAQELAASGEEVAARDRHLGFFAELGELAEKGMWTSAAPLWLGVLDAEHAQPARRPGLGPGVRAAGHRRPPRLCHRPVPLHTVLSERGPAMVRGAPRPRPRPGPAPRAVLVGRPFHLAVRPRGRARLRPGAGRPRPRAKGRQGRRPRLGTSRRVATTF